MPYYRRRRRYGYKKKVYGKRKFKAYFKRKVAKMRKIGLNFYKLRYVTTLDADGSGIIRHRISNTNLTAVYDGGGTSRIVTGKHSNLSSAS